MADLIVENVIWKKGEKGLQRFNIFDSDGITKRNGTGKTYSFKFWKKFTTNLKGSGSLIVVDAVNGIWDYAVQATDTDTPDVYHGEIIEDPGTTDLKSNTFDVKVEDSSEGKT